MAEFQEVMKQYNRLCNEFRSGLHVKYCDECPVSSVKNGKNLTCTEVMRSDPEWFEKTVMDWAAANPEPKYPTWKQWWEDNFPDASERFPPCRGYFMDLGDRRKECRIPCEKCKNTPIPADIAEKLGIKPIGGKENA